MSLTNHTCNYCNYVTNSKSNYNIHLLSKKHKKNIEKEQQDNDNADKAHCESPIINTNKTYINIFTHDGTLLHKIDADKAYKKALYYNKTMTEGDTITLWDII